jgi:hypothetical protein
MTVICFSRHFFDSRARYRLGLLILLLAFLGSTKGASPDQNAPQLVIEARVIEVNDDATDWLAPFVAAGTTLRVSGMLEDAQLSTLWNRIHTDKGVDILSMPQVKTRSGREAKIEIGREFAYMDTSGKPATKQVGTMLKLLPKIDGGNEIDIEVSVQVVGLEGMNKDAKSGLEQPVFNERKATALVSMTSAQTVVLGLPPAPMRQSIVDGSPEGVSTKTPNSTRHTVVFLTASLVIPAVGKPFESTR